MRGRKVEPSLCAGHNKDGSPCVYTAAKDSRYCGHHRSRADVDQAESPVAFYENEPDNESESRDLRAGLAELRGTAGAVVVETWLETAKKATRSLSFKCSCGRTNRVQAPDYNARLKATELIANHSVGRPGQVDAAEARAAVDTDVDVAKLTLEQRAALKKAILARHPEWAAQVRAEAGIQ